MINGYLAAEASGILNWALEGLKDWQKDDHGLGMAPAVAAAGASYRAESDHVAAFVAEACVQDARAHVRPQNLYDAYAAWCEPRPHGAHNLADFKTALLALGFQRVTVQSVSFWKGLEPKRQGDPRWN